MSKVCYIVGAGAWETKPTWRRQDGDLWIAADGGYVYVKHAGITPDLLVGDFDSLEEEPPMGIPIVKHPPQKDETDLYLAYQEGKKRGYDTFCLLGALGGRPDHTYANQQMLLRMHRDGSVGYLQSPQWCMTVLEQERLIFEAVPQKRGYLSVFCMETRAKGVWEQGLLYELFDAELREDFPLGVSNEFTEKEALISVKEGVLMVMWEHVGRPMPRREKVLGD